MALILHFFIAMSVESVSWGAKKAEPVHAAIPSGLPPPLLFEQEVELRGIVPEYTQALIDILGRSGSMSLLPRNRLSSYLKSGKVDFLCYTSRAWAEDRDDFNWADPLFSKREIILGPAPMPKSLKGFKGKTIGTMLGYFYPKFDEQFKNKTIFREDAPNEESNLNKLRNNHISYVIIDEFFLDYYRKEHPMVENGRGRFVLGDYPVQCSVSKHGNVTVKELNAAISKLKSSKKLDEIFKKYGRK